MLYLQEVECRQYTQPVLRCAALSVPKVPSLKLVQIVRLLVATLLHVGMTGKQDGGYTQLT